MLVLVFPGRRSVIIIPSGIAGMEITRFSRFPRVVSLLLEWDGPEPAVVGWLGNTVAGRNILRWGKSIGIDAIVIVINLIGHRERGACEKECGENPGR